MRAQTQSWQSCAAQFCRETANTTLFQPFWQRMQSSSADRDPTLLARCCKLSCHQGTANMILFQVFWQRMQSISADRD